ncbi:MAG TPA: ABC transporter ATP-binding protein [Flavisolibacter sp.]
MSAVIHIEHLSKNFAGLQAVDDLSFSVSAGEVYGFLGQNGAGKSTTMRMLMTLIRPSSGTIRVFGKDIAHHRREVLGKIGAIIEKPDLYKYLTAMQNLRIMAQVSGLQPTDAELLVQLDRVGLRERAHSRVKTFSQGMKQRLGIACALTHNPELIVLDEPTNGLDPQGIADIRNLILHLSREDGKTVFVSSHLLSEIEMIADSMLIIDKGRKVTEGKVSELLNPSHTLVQLETLHDDAAREVLRSSAWAENVQAQENGIVLKMHKNDIPMLISHLTHRQVQIVAVQPKHSLEDFFLSLTTANQNVAAYKN